MVEAAQVEPVEVEEEPEAAPAAADASEVTEDVEDATDPLVEDSKMEEEEKVDEVSRQFLSKCAHIVGNMDWDGGLYLASILFKEQLWQVAFIFVIY